MTTEENILNLCKKGLTKWMWMRKHGAIKKLIHKFIIVPTLLKVTVPSYCLWVEFRFLLELWLPKWTSTSMTMLEFFVGYFLYGMKRNIFQLKFTTIVLHLQQFVSCRCSGNQQAKYDYWFYQKTQHNTKNKTKNQDCVGQVNCKYCEWPRKSKKQT